MSEHYTGIIIGGPLAGRHLAHNGPRFAALVAQRLPFDFRADIELDAKVDAPMEHFHYVHRRVGNVPTWVPHEWSLEQAAEELLRNYRPSACKGD